ncbi:ATP-binding protein [Streptomyces sp. NPDC003077]|uniref:ATP-binding protein n=1 Tax=Streptomyces sp. NPDC003077 TaxID=3154443 RepID=UPI0033BB6860
MPDSTPTRTYKMRAPNTPETAKVARELVAGVLMATDHPSLIDTARLLVSEIVANVCMHTTVPLLLLEATVRGDQLLVSVRDDDPRGIPTARHTALGDSERGRGLLLVEELAAAWGTVWHGGVCPTSKCVWFELRDEPEEDGPRPHP